MSAISAPICEIVRLYGASNSIISKGGSQFISKVWKRFQRHFDAKVKLSTTFHSQVDRLAERVIWTLVDMLRVCVSGFGGNWDDNVEFIEFSYNNIYHYSIGMALYRALYGRRCKTPIKWYESSEVPFTGLGFIMDTMKKVEKII